MGNLAWLLTGGFLKGHRTYVLMGIAVITAGASYAVGDADLATTIVQISTALGLATAAAHKPAA